MNETWKNRYDIYVTSDIIFTVLILLTGILAQFQPNHDYRIMGFGTIMSGILNLVRYITQRWILR